MGWILISAAAVVAGANLTLAATQVRRWPAGRTAVIAAIALVVAAVGGVLVSS